MKKIKASLDKNINLPVEEMEDLETMDCEEIEITALEVLL